MNRDERKKWEKEKKAARIIEIARNVFFEMGYDAATIDEIARLAGYNKRTLYYYFRDKEELFLAVVLEALRLFNEKLASAFNQKNLRHSKLFSLGKAFYDFFIEHPYYFNLIMTYEARNCMYYPETNTAPGMYKEQCQKIADSNTDLIVRAIEEGISAKIIRTTLTPKQLMLILWGHVFGITQIILMRQKYFKQAFGIDQKKFFEKCLAGAERALREGIY